ncbi:JAB domain-containing protein [Taibaiella chishuiensis]|uniref:DNA repair protein RadC n=1 Tax=Taibaiella chishuiensis TaxID=1434707 RepID=A0A2P8D5H8_9BACT|nr:JAB domain-containing protein [Taibaiella chishuiensis]PSK92458.1 DNA repair protein RadC [Taibaiella chishuiensis]
MNVKLNRGQKIQVLNAGDIYSIMQQILLRENKIGRDKEHFWLVCLNSSNRILMIELISLGSAKSTVIDPMDVFSFALQKRAIKLIMVHNHPSGDLQPSAADIDITERMYAIGQFIKMPILDHLIISPKACYSFKEAGMMDKIATEKKYDLTFGELDKLNAQLKKAEKEKAAAEQKAKIEMAKQMLAEGLSMEQVIRISGLTKREVEKLK